MPSVDWGISVKDAKSFDRDKQFAPYRGKVPPNAVYEWRVYRLQFSPGTGDKFPQLRIGVELVPQDKSEKAFKGFSLMTFRTVASHTPFTYVPFLDAIGVSEDDFVNRTRADAEGNIQRIGAWRNTGDQHILAQLIDSDDGKGNAKKDIKWIGPVDELDDEGDDEPDDDDDEYYDEEDEDGEYDDDEDDDYDDD